MPEQSLSNLLPSEDDINQILSHIAKENPSNYATAVLQIELARFMVKYLEKLQGELNKSIKQLEDTILK